MTEASKVATVQHARRWGGWWIAGFVLVGVIGFIASQQLPVLLFKASQVCIGLPLAYVADRTLFSNAPDVDYGMPRDVVSGARLIARAIVALAVVIGITIGL